MFFIYLDTKSANLFGSDYSITSRTFEIIYVFLKLFKTRFVWKNHYF